jgi:hypothetical protein
MKLLSKITLPILLICNLAGATAFAQSRNDAGLRGDAGAVSGFSDANAPVNFPSGATTWWHLLDTRHSNTNNNYAMQFSGSFFDQDVFVRKTNNSPSTAWNKLVLERDGKVGIGTNDTKGFKLAVAGGILAESVRIQLQGSWPDFVFKEQYQLPSLAFLAEHIKQKGHLPGIPSAEEVKANGIDLGEINIKLLQKVEELTLYILEKDKQVLELQKRMSILETKIKANK